MADTVAYLLEEMIPELEDFERRGLFTRPEIKRIVAARREHEYRLKRRAALKEDFLRAIEVRWRACCVAAAALRVWASAVAQQRGRARAAACVGVAAARRAGSGMHQGVCGGC